MKINKENKIQLAVFDRQTRKKAEIKAGQKKSGFLLGSVMEKCIFLIENHIVSDAKIW